MAAIDLLFDIYAHLAYKNVEGMGSRFKGNMLHHSVKFFELSDCLFFFLLEVHAFKEMQDWCFRQKKISESAC